MRLARVTEGQKHQEQQQHDCSDLVRGVAQRPHDDLDTSEEPLQRACEYSVIVVKSCML